MVLHLTGRRSGRRYEVPVAHHDLDGRLVVLTDSAWRVNLRGGADVEVTLRGERSPMRAELDEDPATVAAAYRALIDRIGWEKAQRRLGVAVHVGRAPTLGELEAAARETGLSVVTLTPR